MPWQGFLGLAGELPFERTATSIVCRPELGLKRFCLILQGLQHPEAQEDHTCRQQGTSLCTAAHLQTVMQEGLKASMAGLSCALRPLCMQLWLQLHSETLLQGLTLKRHIEATLGQGNIREAVRLPPGEDLNEWLAVNTVDFYNAVSILYSTLEEFCTSKSCPAMTAGHKVSPGTQMVTRHPMLAKTLAVLAAWHGAQEQAQHPMLAKTLAVLAAQHGAQGQAGPAEAEHAPLADQAVASGCLSCRQRVLHSQRALCSTSTSGQTASRSRSP